MPTQPTDPHLALAAGIVSQAAIDAKNGDPSALAWLRGDQAAFLVEGLGIDENILTRWADARQKKQPALAGCTKQKGT